MSDENLEKPALASITDIAADWGLTNRELGDILRNSGFREGGKPTAKALNANLAVSDYPRFLWSRDLVGRLLEQTGRRKGRMWNR